MTPGQLSILRALALSAELMRLQVEALLLSVDTTSIDTATGSATGCPKCGATGETQIDTPRLDGSLWKVCGVCGTERAA